MEATERQLTETGPAIENRTGIMTSPELSRELIEITARTGPSAGSVEQLAGERAEFIEEADPIGSLPETSDGSVGQAVLMDKLGERLAFERQGSRLYEAMIHKCESRKDAATTSPPLDELKEIYEQEKQHFAMLQDVIVDLGGDPTMITPSADVSAMIATGPVQVVTDPRTNVSQSLQAILTAELADNEGWQLLKELASGLDRDDLAEKFDQALEEEDEHLEKVRFWLLGMVLEQADVDFEVAEEELTDEEEEVAPKPARQSKSQGSQSKSQGKRSAGGKSPKKKR